VGPKKQEFVKICVQELKKISKEKNEYSKNSL